MARRGFHQSLGRFLGVSEFVMRKLPWGKLGAWLVMGAVALSLGGCQAYVPPKTKLKGDWLIYNAETRVPVKLSDFDGEVVFLNIWATWCKPCLDEMPSIQEVYDEYHPQGVKFIIVTMGESRNVEKELQRIRDFARKNKYTMPFYVAFEKPPAQLMDQAIPVTVYIDADHRIRLRKEGMTNWTLPNWTVPLEKMIEEAKVKASPKPE